MVNYNIDLNIKYDNTVDTGIYLAQGDYGRIQFTFRIKNDGEYVTDAVSGEIHILINNQIAVAGELSRSGNTYTYQIKGNELSEPGKAVADIKLKYSDGRTSSCCFIYYIRADTITEESLEAGGYIGKLDQLQKDAQQLLDDLKDYKDIYPKVMEAASNAIKADDSAALSADTAGTAAQAAESWAVGGTGSRKGENGDNSRFYATESKTEADRSRLEADRAAQYAHIVAPGFYVDLETMALFMKAGVGVDFAVTEDCELCWKVS